MMTIEEHVAEADRLMEQAAAHSGMNATIQAQRDVALARAHLHAAQVLGEIQAANDRRQMQRDFKANSALMTDLTEKLLPGGLPD